MDLQPGNWRSHEARQHNHRRLASQGIRCRVPRPSSTVACLHGDNLDYKISGILGQSCLLVYRFILHHRPLYFFQTWVIHVTIQGFRFAAFTVIAIIIAVRLLILVVFRPPGLDKNGEKPANSRILGSVCTGLKKLL